MNDIPKLKTRTFPRCCVVYLWLFMLRRYMNWMPWQTKSRFARCSVLNHGTWRPPSFWGFFSASILENRSLTISGDVSEPFFQNLFHIVSFRVTVLLDNTSFMFLEFFLVKLHLPWTDLSYANLSILGNWNHGHPIHRRAERQHHSVSLWWWFPLSF